MAAQGYIGRAPGESSVVVARQTFTPTGITTNFTFASGYAVGYVDAYLNGARLIEGDDYTATDGSVVGLTTHAINGDVLELVAYKAFNLANVTGANGDFIVPDKIIHKEDTDTAIRFPQADTFTVETAGSEVFRVDANGNVGIGTTNTLRIADPKNQSGINVGFITANSITAAAGSFGSLNVTGTLSYEDVANQDVVGFSTFQKGIVVQGAGSTTTTLNVTGVSTFAGTLNAATVSATSFSGDGSGLTGVASTDNINTSTLAQFTGGVGIADSIFHIGDDNTAIRFPAADTFTIETGGTEAFRVDSSQQLLLGTTSSYAVGSSAAGNLQISGSLGFQSLSRFSANAAGPNIILGKSRNASPGSSTVVQDDDDLGNITFAGDDGTDLQSVAARIVCEVDGTPGSNDMPGRLTFHTTADGASSPTERLRIDSSGRLLVSTTSSTSNIAGFGNGGIQLNSTTTAQACVNLIHRNNSSNIHAIVLAKGRDGGANGGRVQDNDDFGAISFQGFDGTGGASYRQGAEIRGAVDGTPGNANMPGRLEFLTTPNGSATPTERLRIGSSGQIGLGGANYGTSGQVLTSNGSGSAVTWEDAAGGGGITTTKYSPAANATIQIGLGTAQHHELRLSAGFTTVTTSGGNFGESHSLVLVQPSSGICTVGFSTFFQFPSGATPSMSEGGGKVDLVSFVVKDIAGNTGTGATELLASVGLNYS